jgi:uncharacterized protein
MLLAAVLLGFATCAAWLPPLQVVGGNRLAPWAVGLSAATAAAFSAGLVDMRGLLAIAALCIAGFASQHIASVRGRRAATVVAVTLAFALGVQALPGFPDAIFIDRLRLSPDAAPMRLSLNFAPGAAGLVLLALFCRRVETWRELAAVARSTAAVAAITTAVVMGLGLAVGYVRLDFKLPWITVAYLVKTLLYTAVLEEAFFCGIVQEGLTIAPFIAKRPALRWLPTVVASALFAIAHAPAGPIFVMLALVAGVGYSVAYALARRVEAAIAVHFAVNAVHFVGFTYPHFSQRA